MTVPPSPHKRTLTTVIAAVLLCLGILGLALSGWGLAALLAGEDMPLAIARSSALIDAALQVLGKCGLTAMAATLFLRRRSAMKAAIAGLSISAMGSLHTVFAVIPAYAAAAGHGFGYAFGAYAVSALSLTLYIGPILYLRTETSRREFDL